jgi:hypothetical protein
MAYPGDFWNKKEIEMKFRQIFVRTFKVLSGRYTKPFSFDILMALTVVLGMFVIGLGDRCEDAGSSYLDYWRGMEIETAKQRLAD